MKVISVYEQYFGAKYMFEDGEDRIEYKGVVVSLVATSDNGHISYEVKLTFFPYQTPDDFVIPFMATNTKIIYDAKGRRSKKREAVLLEEFRAHADELAAQIDGIIYWDKPLIPAKYD